MQPLFQPYVEIGVRTAASSVLVTDDLAAGRLVRPFGLAMDVELAYYVVCLEPAADQPRIKAFRDWVITQAVARRPA